MTKSIMPQQIHIVLCSHIRMSIKLEVEVHTKGLWSTWKHLIILQDLMTGGMYFSLSTEPLRVFVLLAGQQDMVLLWTLFNSSGSLNIQSTIHPYCYQALEASPLKGYATHKMH